MKNYMSQPWHREANAPGSKQGSLRSCRGKGGKHFGSHWRDGPVKIEIGLHRATFYLGGLTRSGNQLFACLYPDCLL